jgi:hypothetical protein
MPLSGKKIAIEMKDLEAGEKDPLLREQRGSGLEDGEGDEDAGVEVIIRETEMFSSVSLVGVLLPIFALGLLALGFLLSVQLDEES